MFFAGGVLFCGMVLVFMSLVVDASPGKKGCRDEVVSKVPIFPDAVLLDSNEVKAGIHSGSIMRSYSSSSTLEDVGEFYHAISPCPRLFLLSGSDDTLLCTGHPHDDDSRVYYEVEIEHQEYATYFSLYIGWDCGYLDD